MNKIELLSPAGDMSKLKTALYFGADAVYIGGKHFSLRALAGNFTDEEILEILNEDGTDEERIEKIVAVANEHGGRDNMGIILVNPQL